MTEKKKLKAITNAYRETDYVNATYRPLSRF